MNEPTQNGTESAPSDDDPTPIVDGHNDTLLALADSDDPVAAFADGLDDAHLDLPRARSGGLGVGLFATFVRNDERPDRRETDDGYAYPVPDAIDHERARADTYRTLELLHRIGREIDGVRVVRTLDELDACLADGALGIVPHIEGAAGIAADRSNLDFLYAAGVRSIGPVWSRPNQFGDGVPARYPGDPDTGDGLTDAGRELVRGCAERGILVDCAHMTAQGLRDTDAILDGPLVVSHTAAHAVHPHSRNLTDEQIRLVAESDGLIGITFSTGALGASEPGEDVGLDALLDHVEHVAHVAGVEHVALGSDFDGAGIPDEIGDASGLPAVIDGLRERGFDEAELALIARENWRRVLAESWSGKPRAESGDS